jgi:hypothetical protein
LEETRDSITADLSYYDTVFKNALQIAAVLDLASPGSFLDPDIADQPMGFAFLTIRHLYSELETEVTDQTLPSLRDCHGMITKVCQRYDNYQRCAIADLRRLVQQYESESDQLIRDKRQLASLPSFADSMLDHGEKCHTIGAKLLSGFAAIEKRTIEELRTCDDDRRVVFAQEDSIIFSATNVIYSALPIGEAPPPQKRLGGTQEVLSVFISQAKSIFFELRSFVGNTSVLSLELVPKLWNEGGEGTVPFYARVWGDWKGGFEGLAVTKRETVQVLQVTQTPFWVCKNLSGQTGLVPSALLEAVE